MANLSQKMMRQRERLHIRAYGVLCLVLLLVMGAYSWLRFSEYRGVKAGIAANEKYIEGTLRNNVIEERARFETRNEDFQELNSEIEQKLADIFPADDQYTDLVRQFDAFEEELNSKDDPFVISSLDFQAPSDGELYSVLPIRMNIRSSAKNFRKLLQLVEDSGALTNQVRLMDISSIRLSFEGAGGGVDRDDQLISFAVQINAYFQKPV